MILTLELCKPKRAPKYNRATNSWLWQLATSNADPPRKELAFGQLYVDCAYKDCCLFNRAWGWACGGRFGSAFGWHPYVSFHVMLNRRVAIMVGNLCPNFHKCLRPMWENMTDWTNMTSRFNTLDKLIAEVEENILDKGKLCFSLCVSLPL